MAEFNFEKAGLNFSIDAQYYNKLDVDDVFTGEKINKAKYDVDHFIPWSFVMNDELWNLMPMDSNLNSSKSNRLPDWEIFFEKFARNQYD